jgi:hypothetical protein
MSLRDEVLQQIARAIDEMRSATRISPTTVAMHVFEFYSRQSYDEHLAYASIEHIKHLARSVLARQHEPEQRAGALVDEQGDMFDDLLQDRYPIKVKRGQEPQYELRHYMSHDDVQWNVQRMRKVGASLLKHADAFEAWDKSRRVEGESA